MELGSKNADWILFLIVQFASRPFSLGLTPEIPGVDPRRHMGNQKTYREVINFSSTFHWLSDSSPITA